MLFKALLYPIVLLSLFGCNISSSVNSNEANEIFNANISGNGSAFGYGLENGICIDKPTLSVHKLNKLHIAELGTPFDPELPLHYPGGPLVKWAKNPDLIAQSTGNGLDILFKDQDSAKAFIVHYEDSKLQYAFEIEHLGTIVGFTRGENGMRYYATSVIDGKNIPTEHRSNTLRIVGFDDAGCIRFESDVDMARGEKDLNSPIAFQAMNASTGRLVYGNGTLALLHGFKTKTGHQRSMITHIDVNTARAVRTGGAWVSHSLDQRMIFADNHFIDLQLGDGAPRGLVLSGLTPDGGVAGKRIFKSPGRSNQTYTRVGGIAPIEKGEFGYLVVFSADRASDVSVVGWKIGLNLGLIRIKRDFWDLEDSIPIMDTGSKTINHRVISKNVPEDNYLQWLVDYKSDSANAHRPRIIPMGNDQFMVMWERWPGEYDFEGTYAMMINSEGDVLKEAKRITDYHLPQENEPVKVGDKAVIVSGSKSEKALIFIEVDNSLNVQITKI